MKITQLMDLTNVLVAFTDDGGIRDGEQLIGRLAHR
jgi:hypothetical protein